MKTGLGLSGCFECSCAFRRLCAAWFYGGRMPPRTNQVSGNSRKGNHVMLITAMEPLVR
jgi:hypothetical protein